METTIETDVRCLKRREGPIQREVMRSLNGAKPFRSLVSRRTVDKQPWELDTPMVNHGESSARIWSACPVYQVRYTVAASTTYTTTRELLVHSQGCGVV